MRKYHHIISLGLNCEPSYALEDMYGRLDSYPLSWALVPDVANLLNALAEMSLLFSEGYDIAHGSFDMFRCRRTGIQFHGKTNLRACGYQEDIVEAAFNELMSRMRHLYKKFHRALASGRGILCIVKNHNRGASSRGFSTEEALALKSALDSATGDGLADLLCIDSPIDASPEFELRCAGLGIHKRFLETFAPGERAYFYDLPGWARIFAEFDSIHSSFQEAGFEERVQAIQRHLEMRRKERLRDIRERTQRPPDVSTG